MQNQTQRIFEFDEFRLDASQRQLLRRGEPIPLHPKTFEMLLVLVENHGQLLTKDNLLNLVWADRFVEESNLTVNMSQIRKALGEQANKPRYIKTISGKGYRFVADVRESHLQPEELIVESEIFARLTVEQEEIENGTAVASPSPIRLNKKRVAVVLGSVLFLAASLALGGYIWQREHQKAADTGAPPQLFQPTSVKRLTTTGNVSLGALSPDGKLFAFSMGEKGSPQQSLWLGHTDGRGEPILLRPPTDGSYGSLSFAPDGSSIYYVKIGVREWWQGTLYKLPSFGGVPEKLGGDVPVWIAIAPDEQRFAFVRDHKESNRSSIIIADLREPSSESELASRPISRGFNGRSLSWSPDGRIIAASAIADDEAGQEIFTVSVTDGKIRQHTDANWYVIRASKWLNDGREILIAAQEEDAYDDQKLWQVSSQTGEVRRLYPDLHSYGSSVSLSGDNRDLLLVQYQDTPNLWVASVDDLRAAKQITYGTRRDGKGGLDWMPNGGLVHGAMSDDSLTIWTMDPGGGNQRQLTSAGYVDEQPSVTADGSTIVFQSNRSGKAEIWRMNSSGGDLRQVTSGGGNSEPHVAPNGKWIVFKGQDRSLWRVPVEGGEVARLTAGAASWPRISPDSRFVACEYEREGKTKLAVFSIEGGEPLKLFDVPKSANFRGATRWTPDGNAIAYRDWFNGLWKQPLGGGEPARLEGLPTEKLYSYGWSLDGKQFAFVPANEVSDLVLLRR